MQRALHFPIKGTFYYSADLAIEMGLLKKHTNLHFVFEPDNAYDPFAIQIWLKHKPSNSLKAAEYLLGYVPRMLTKPLNQLLHSYQVKNLQVTHLAKHGQFIEIDCKLIIQQPIWQFIYLLSLTKISQHSHAIKRLRRRWMRDQP